MSFNPATDFVAMFRNLGGSVAKERMPSLDFVVAALGRAGLITVTTSATAPVASQNVTAWFKPANPSYTGEGVLYLWNPANADYEPASAALLWQLLLAASNSLGTSWYIVAGGPPANTVGNNGDFSIRSDFPGGLYGPKVAGAWPASPLPGSTYAVDSAALDVTFGSTPGAMIYRGASQWQALEASTVNTILAVTAGPVPGWVGVSGLLDALFGSTQGAIMYRGAANWAALAPGTAGYNLVTNGGGLNPSWAVPGAEFASGTVLVFRQTSAPVNWTKQTAVNDAGLRVTSGAISTGGSVAFSTLFGTTQVGATTLGASQIPSHTHGYSAPAFYNTFGGGSFGATGSPSAAANTDGGTGGGGSHTHSHDMRLTYADVIIATKN